MRPRLVDVASLAGVSMKTVSNVVNGAPHVSDAVRQRVQAAIDELGYRPNEAARSLKTGSSGIVGVLVPQSAHPSARAVAEAIAAEGERRGLRVVLVSETADPVRAAREAFELLESRLSTGLPPG